MFAAQLVPIAARNNLQSSGRCIHDEGLHVVARVALRAELGEEVVLRLPPPEEDERVAGRFAVPDLEAAD